MASLTDLWGTLETLIAPGQRVRLSPFVETAQCSVLFGERPDNRQRVESICGLLARHADTVNRIAAHWSSFVADGKDFARNDYSTPDFLDAYLAYYFSVNVPKVQLVLLDLARDGRLRGDIVLLDVGVGTGTTAIAVLDFLLAWGQVCDLHQQPFPVTGLRLVGLDRSEGSLEYARRMVDRYAEALQERLRSRQSVGAGAPDASDILQRVHDWALAATWRRHDLSDAPLILDDRPNLLVAANVRNELCWQGQEHFDALLGGLADSGLAVVIEPGDQGKATNLMRWRRDFLARNSGFVALGPCGQEFATALPACCNDCWNLRREGFHQHPLYRAFREATPTSRDDRRSFDDYENRLLSWSYVVIGRGHSTSTNQVPTHSSVRPGMVIEDPLTLRYIGSYRKERGLTVPVDYAPDAFRATATSRTDTWSEYLKVCPAGHGAARLALKRPPGFQVPPLTFGERFTLSHVHVGQPGNGAYTLEPLPGDRTTVERTASGDGGHFLPVYDAKADSTVRHAIDEIACRLFGFTAMRPFQHTILARVLTGRSILGIAATGGGKSECFILPAMLLPGLTIVVSPLKSLMTDQYDQRIRKRYGLDYLATYINGDVPFAERQARLRRMELGRYKLVYFTPEQLERGYVLDSLSRANDRVGIRYLALDEAHCISQWGHDFRPSYLNIIHRFQTYGLEPVRIALTATASPEVRTDICEELKLNPASVLDGGDVFIESSNRPELNLIVRVRRTMGEKVDGILDDLRRLQYQNEANDMPGAAIVFMPHTGGVPDDVCETAPNSAMGRKSTGVTPFASYLERQLGQPVAIYHGRMDTDEPDERPDEPRESAPGDMRGRKRRAEQDAFIGGERSIMVATKGFGMGIDKPNIRLVIHRTPPANLEAYAQEAGRAGRDGEPADVILYYSPDRPHDVDESGKARRIKSDYDIQSFFLKERYVRREGVGAMRAFLRSLTRRIGDTLYFTNDEAIAFFDRYSDDGGRSAWPEFPLRQPTGRESIEHQAILDRGHDYQQKTNYLNRILQALYRLRPPTAKGNERVTFLELVQETGAEIKDPQVLDSRRILDSNTYFGRILRDAGIDAAEFTSLVRARDVLDIARRLGLSVYETSWLLHDIKFAEESFNARSRKWQPDLLNFQYIVVPQYGPAAGKTSLDAWRRYAGATGRANGYERAGRAHPTLNDWFPWKKLPRSRGWEVRLGPALDDEHFAQSLDAFMELHDQREQNDWAAYRRLLTDYIGVDEQGDIIPGTPGKQCLRAVLLGYLKTYETIRDGNCFSCNRCVPDERFDRYSLEQRQAAVVRLGQRLAGLLDRAEAHSNMLPPVTLLDDLFIALQEEEAQGNAVVRYVEGWSARILDDQADHRAALCVRLRLMRDGLVEIQPRAFGEAAKLLVRATQREDSGPLWELLAHAHEDGVLRDEPAIHMVQADLCHRLGLPIEGEGALRRVIDFSIRHPEEIGPNHVRVSYRRLRNLYDSTGPLANLELWRDSQLHLARLSTDVQTAEREYAPLVADWPWEDVVAELKYCGTGGQNAASAQFGLLCAWVQVTEMLRQQKIAQVMSYLVAEGQPLAARAKEQDVRTVIARVGIHPFAEHARLAACFAEVLLAGHHSDDGQLQAGFPLCLMAITAGERLSAQAMAAITNTIFRGGNITTFVKQVLRQYSDDRNKMSRILLSMLSAAKLMDGKRLEQWFAVFPIEMHLRLPSDTTVKVLQSVEPTKLSDAVIEILWRLTTVLAFDAHHGLTVHRLWLGLCQRYPTYLVEYLQWCLTSAMPDSSRAEEAFDHLLMSGNARLLVSFFTWIRTRSEQIPSQRIARASTFYRILCDHLQARPGRRHAMVGREDFLALRRAVAPQLSVERADMLVAAMEVLVERLNPRWLTPIEFEAEALCDAYRLDEAAVFTSQNPDIKVGPQRELLSARIERLRQLGRLRSPDKQVKDYARIMRLCFMPSSQ